MKRKYLSALLMGTLTVASMSTFTSCKDYDDDISNLQGQIDKLATADQLSQKVAELQALISSNKSDISSLQSELAKKTTLDEVKAVLADYATKQYVDAADKTLQDAIDALKTGDIAKLKEDVVKAQAAADKAADDAKAANAEIVETLKTLATKTELKDAAKAAQDAIDAVKSENAQKLKEAQDAITETLKGYATKSDVEDGDKKTLESLASTIKNASDALALANTNKQAIADALDILGKGYSKENTVAAAIEAIKGQIGTPNKELGTLDSRLAAIESVLNGVKDDETKLGLVAKVTNIENKLKDIIGEYTTMVTEVSLVGSAYYSDDLNKFGYDNNGVTINAIPLSFTSGKVGFKGKTELFNGEYVFGKDEKDNTNKSVTAADQQKFVKGTPFNDEQTLVVRVNPTNAVLTSASIKLVDSQGNDLDDILEIGEPKQFTGLITRASQNTGLWSIPVNVKAGVAQKAIAKLKDSKFIAYAVAVKNTETQKDAEDRYVRSTYDVIVPEAKDFKAVNNIDEVQIWSESTMTEKNAITLGTAKKKTSDASNETTAKVVRAKNNETINIKFPAEDAHGNVLYGGKVKYFYVVRDDHNTDTQGSDQSELNAWKGYKYDGTAYGKVIAADPMHPGTLKINIGGSSVADDEIGFRVFAINYNGQLASRNGGQSFVVYVGDEQNKATVEGNVAALYEKTDATNPQDLKLNETGWLKLSSALKDRSDATTATAFKSSYDVKVGNQTVTFDVEFSENGEKKADATVPYSKLKYVKFICTSKMAEWQDDLKAVGSIKTTNKKGLVENEIKFSLTKVLPTKESTIAWMGYKWKAAQKDENGNYTAYVYPTGNVWTAATATTGYKKMSEAINGLKPGTVFHVEGVEWDDAAKKYKDAEFTSPWEVTVPVALIDAKTPHKTTIGFNYGNISSAKNGEPYIIYVEEVQTIFACPLAMSAQSYELTKMPITDKNGKVTGYKDVNYLTYGSAKTVDDVNILDYIIGSNKFANEFEGKLSSRALDKYAGIKAQVISKESGKADYFTVTFDNVVDKNNKVIGKKMVFHPAVNASSPLRDVESELVITLTDAFGHNDMVYKFPFTVKKR